jgi:superfamily II DNA or RNA helicase
MASKPCILVIHDTVNVKFEGLDPHIRRRISEALKFFLPHARHSPSFKLGRWDGKVSFCTAGGSTYLNLIDRILPIVLDEGYDVQIDDRRASYSFAFPEVSETMVADRVWPAGHPMAGQPITLRDYQVQAIRDYITNPQSIQCISTGAGKTLLTATLSLLVEPYGRSIVVVPSKSLVIQTEADYKNLGLDVGVYYGDRKEWRTHTICTWQSLSSLAKQTRREEAEIGIDEFIEGVVCVMIDEAHTIRGTELLKLLSGPLAKVPIRWGMTGTIPKEDWEFMNLLASVGPVVGEVRAADLQAKGVLASLKIHIEQLEDEHVAFSSYPDEHDYLVTDRQRVEWIGKRCAQIAEGGNTLVLVNRIETGEMLTSLIPGAVFVSGQTKAGDRAKEYDEVQTADTKLIIATYGVAAVGINIPRIFNLVLLECGKSFTRTVQSVGRILRKAADKDAATVYDICSSLKFSKRHLTKRKEYYREAQYPFTVTKVKWR